MDGDPGLDGPGHDCGRFYGVLIQRIAYRPMLSAPRLSILITAVGVSLVLFNAVMALTSGEIHGLQHGA